MAYESQESAVASERPRLKLKPRDPEAVARAERARAASEKSVRTPARFEAPYISMKESERSACRLVAYNTGKHVPRMYSMTENIPNERVPLLKQLVQGISSVLQLSACFAWVISALQEWLRSITYQSYLVRGREADRHMFCKGSDSVSPRRVPYLEQQSRERLFWPHGKVKGRKTF